MRKHIVKHREILQVIISVMIALASAVDMMGRPARLVTILTLTAGALGTGISIGVFIERRRKEKQKKSPQEHK
jgi:hypothetical protein